MHWTNKLATTLLDGLYTVIGIVWFFRALGLERSPLYEGTTYISYLWGVGNETAYNTASRNVRIP